MIKKANRGEELAPTQQRNEYFDQENRINVNGNLYIIDKNKINKSISNCLSRLNIEMDRGAFDKKDYNDIYKSHYNIIHIMNESKKHNELIALMKKWAEEGSKAQQRYALSFFKRWN